MPSVPILLCLRRRPAAAAFLLAFLLLAVAPLAAESAEERIARAAQLENPVPYTEESIREGRKHYLRYCQSCHGYDGRALENIDFEATDLTAPDRWRFGTSDGAIFLTTREGAGLDMPPFAARLDDREIWELVNFVRSLGPEELRPSP